MAEEDNFFSRWSRRKVQKQTGEPLPEPAVPSTAQPAVQSQPQVHPQAAPAAGVAPAPASTSQTVAQPQPEEKAPPPTLQDVARLTQESDFSRFVGKDVSPDVRNAAMKKLFANPNFNVMDGLDIYIDDYSIPSPMSKDFARTLASAKFMKLFDEPEQAGTPAKSEGQPPAEPAGADPTTTHTSEPGPAPEPESEPSASTPSPTSSPSAP